MVDYYYDTHGLLGTCVQENGLLNQHHEIQGGGVNFYFADTVFGAGDSISLDSSSARLKTWRRA